jgi:hypothetical protein
VAGVHPAQGERNYGLMLAPLSFARLLSVKPGSIARNRASASRDSTMLPNRAQAVVNSSTSRLAFVSVMLVQCCRRLTNAQGSGAAVYLPPLPPCLLRGEDRVGQERAHPLSEVLGGIPAQERADEEPRAGAKAGLMLPASSPGARILLNAVTPLK